MHMIDLFQLALRGLSRRMVRTTLTALGIVVAVASMVIFLSLGEGIRKVFSEELGNIGPDIQVSLNGIQQGGTPVPNLDIKTVEQVKAKSDTYGIRSITPVIYVVRSGGFDPKQSFFFYGYPPSENILDFAPNTELASGRLLNAQDALLGNVLIGAKAAENGNLQIGSILRYNRRTSLKVVGILKAAGGLSDSVIYTPLKVMQSAVGAEGKISGINIKLIESARSKEVAALIQKDFDLEAQTQADFLKVLDRAVSISDAIRFGISLIALIVGGLAVANTVMMGVFERTREFGTMRAIGAQPSFVWKLVLLESLMLSVLGGLGGLVLGGMGIVVVNFYTQELASVNMAALTPRLALLAMGISLILGLLAGLLPARNAGRIAITEALGRN